MLIGGGFLAFLFERRLRPVRPRRRRRTFIRRTRLGMTARAWAFTCFDLSVLDTLKAPIEGVKYLACQVERCTETDRLHIQGYAEFTSPHRRGGAQRRLCIGASHATPARNRTQARDYVLKVDSRVDGPWEVGEWVPDRAGTRTDLDAVRKRLDDGATSLDIATADFAVWARHHRAIERYRLLRCRGGLREVRVVLITGPTGSGKSYTAYHEWPDAYRLAPPNISGGAVWFDGYDGESTVVIDDFDGWVPYRRLLTLLDPYPCAIPTKGGTCWAGWTCVVLTSCRPIEAWYPGCVIAELERRISETRTLSERHGAVP